MKRVGIFIRNDARLVDVMRLLMEKTNLVYVIFKDENVEGDLVSFCLNHKINYFSHASFVDMLSRNKLESLDIILSYYYQKKLEQSILDYPKNKCINFHPAPLPKYRGVGNYSKCIMDETNYWGVSAHFMDETYDNGELIKVLTFEVFSRNETYISLEQKTQKYMFELLRHVLNEIVENSIFSQKQEYYSIGVEYLSKKMIEEMKVISEEDNSESIDKKIRAFWCPPFHGAGITLHGKRYTLINDSILNELKELYELKGRS
ncbi:formyltransferase family protein [Paenibacillus sp. GCM10012303]|uniref:formyltransferase family protein n=1 Tax=Paenibacillus sp. GCM10012303 TaxID=3317340 RepID=UPI0036206ED2